MTPEIPATIEDWPDLSYHYGITPRELVTLPPWLLNHYRSELPRIIAQEEMRLIQATTFPRMKRSSQSSIMQQLKAQGHIRRATGHRAKTEDEYRGMLAMSGIGFTKEPPKGVKSDA